MVYSIKRGSLVSLSSDQLEISADPCLAMASKIQIYPSQSYLPAPNSCESLESALEALTDFLPGPSSSKVWLSLFTFLAWPRAQSYPSVCPC